MSEVRGGLSLCLTLLIVFLFPGRAIVWAPEVKGKEKRGKTRHSTNSQGEAASRNYLAYSNMACFPI